ncbi:cation tolerance protein CutA [Methylovorus sp. MM2]|uniref:divalent-cation tolerance protein CutA n=1 Tax=Methylovorus sp. MM2 TaxID=1848038 RepID=UPI0007E0BBFB|nr:divalent-cation tolerance protein CutA [Methylovorus sp. MM2]OAM51954.1 cation tolerance protein CutA [Methylovorus sp. MM2]
MTTPATPILVLTNLPDTASAEKLASYLVEERLAACVNIMAPCTSIYQWQGKVERTTEISLFIKSTSLQYDALERAIRQQHPYELPEIIHVSIDGGLAEYLAWLVKETSA